VGQYATLNNILINHFDTHISVTYIVQKQKQKHLVNENLENLGKMFQTKPDTTRNTEQALHSFNMR